MKNLKTFEEFIKMGTSSIVKDHYSGSESGKKGYSDLSDADDAEEKGGKVDHTEKVKAKDLSDPKINEAISTLVEQVNVDMKIEELQEFVKKYPIVKESEAWESFLNEYFDAHPELV